MEVVYQVTPEMVGLEWRRVVRYALAAAATALLWGLVFSKLFHGRFLTGSVIGLVISALVCAFLMRPFSRTKLRITDESIEESDGPIIRKDAIARVNEYVGQNSGIEIVGKRRPLWLPPYHIFVPAALPQYAEVKKLVEGWTTPQQWHSL